jgi:hypothetical protein
MASNHNHNNNHHHHQPWQFITTISVHVHVLLCKRTEHFSTLFCFYQLNFPVLRNHWSFPELLQALNDTEMGLTPEPGSISLYNGTAAIVTSSFHCLYLDKFLVCIFNQWSVRSNNQTCHVDHLLPVPCVVGAVFPQTDWSVKLTIHLLYWHLHMPANLGKHPQKVILYI